MGYDPSSFYQMGYDYRGMPLPMHSGGYDMPMDMYLPQSSSYSSSRSRNPAGVSEEDYSQLDNHTPLSSSMVKKSIHFLIIPAIQMPMEVLVV